ncbi:MCE family protein [Mycolicibacterium sp. CBMA 226]|uniref:MCE family protein n=1 Tax=Mycolicibacterium sp. CBMA 226 TaxID=2606611 RepID=UPI001307247E|nr:MCE family protein [Mycolicibacterium sp. CBMA 226]MUL78715.1 MCE family protein [Mycolicibacterium sp. CBMA 226]
MSYRKPIIGLAIFLVISMVVTWLVFNTLSRQISGSTNTYSAVFTDVTGLHEGDDVRVAGVRVGRVDAVELDGTQANVTFQVQKDQKLFADTIAAIRYQNIIGQRYLGLSRGQVADQRALPNNGRIPVEHTEPSFDITYLLKGFEPLLTLLDPKQVDNLTNALIDALQGENGTVLSLITQTSALADMVAGPDDVLGQVITNLNAVTTNLAGQSANLNNVIGRTRDILVGLNSHREQLRASVGSINSALGRLSTITNNIYPDFNALVTRQPGFASNLTGPGRDRFAFLAANLPYLLKGVARMTQSGAYTDIYICDVNVSIFRFLKTLIPAYVAAATPGNVINHSAVCR